MSPAVSKRQQQFFGAELARKRAGKKTKTKMTEKQLREFASTKTKGLPKKRRKNDKVNKTNSPLVLRTRTRA